MTGGWLEEIGRQLRSVGDVLLDEVRAGGLLPLLEPAPPFNRPGLLAPAIAVGGLIAIILLSGMAVTALGSLLLALLGPLPAAREPVRPVDRAAPVRGALTRGS